MGWNRASTFNLNIRYGRQLLALLTQAAAFRLRKNLPKPYKSWTAVMLSRKVFTNMEGDIRVKDDTIIITYYKDHEVPWLKDITYYNDFNDYYRAANTPMRSKNDKFNVLRFNEIGDDFVHIMGPSSIFLLSPLS